MIAGSLEVMIFAGLARLHDDMQKAQSMVGGSMRNIERSVGQAKAALGALGIGLSMGYFVHLIKGSIDAADRLGDLTKSTNLTVSELAGLNLLAKQSGTDLEGLAKAVNKMSVEMGKDPEKFRALGITAKSSKEALMQFADVFKQLPDQYQRNALAQAVFGKSWEQLAPVLAEGGKKIGEIIDRGALLSGNTQQMTEDADRFNDQMAELNITLGATKNKLVGDMLPGMNRIAEAMREAARDSNLFTVALVGVGGAVQELFGDSDLVKAQKQLDQMTLNLAHWQEKQKNVPRWSIVKQWILGDDFSKEIAQAERELSGALKSLEAEKARLNPAAATAAASNVDKTAEAQRFLDVEKRRAELIKRNELEDRQIIEQEKDRYDEELRIAKQAADDITAANKKAADESAREWERFQENVQRNLGDVLYLGLQNKFNDIGDLFKHLLLRMTADAGAARLTQALFGGMGAAASGSAAAAGGSAAASGGVMATLGTTTAGGTALSTGAIMALHVAVPVAAAYVIAKYGFGWGNGRENVGGNRLVGNFGRAGFSGGFEQSWKQDGGLFGGDETGVVKTAVTTAQGRAFKATVDALQGTFNDLGSSIGDLSLRTRAWNVNVNQAGDVTGRLADGIAMQLLPQLEKFRAEGENLADTARRLTGIFATTNSFIVALGLSSQEAFGAIGINSTDARQRLTDLAGGPEAFGQKAGSFVQNFLTGAQQLQPALDSVARTFLELGISGIETNQQFAERVKLELQLGNYDTVDRLLSVSDAFNTVTKAAADTSAQLLALIKTDSFKTLADYKYAVIRAQVAGSANTAGAGGTIAGAVSAVQPVVAAEVSAASAARAAVKAEALAEAIRLGNVVIFQGRGITQTAKSEAERFGYTTGRGGTPLPSPQNSYLDAMAYYNGLPAYAGGGSFPGGLRIVGENGPELEMTGPSRIASNSDSRKLLDNSELVIEIRALRAEVASLRTDNRAAQAAIASSSLKTAKTLDRWEGGGMPVTRAA